MKYKDELGNRMKTFYEQIPKTSLVHRMPVIIRIDGKTFHSFTKYFKKPFDQMLIRTMQETTRCLCENIQGCVLGYTQSDEISLLLIDYQNLNSSPWFDNEVQKIVSISASMATLYFNKIMEDTVSTMDQSVPFFDVYTNAVRKGAMFDSRCFNIPREEVTNYFYWRQLDAIRNSILSVGQASFSSKQLHKKSCNMIKEMLSDEKGIDWNDYPDTEKQGSCCIKETYTADQGLQRSRWVIDNNIPKFVKSGRDYIEKYLYVDENN